MRGAGAPLLRGESTGAGEQLKIAEKIWEQVRRAGGRVVGGNPRPGRRRTAPLPSISNTYATHNKALPKRTPVNLRRFAETPLARKAINTVKDRVAGMRWRIQPRHGRKLEEAQGEERIAVLTRTWSCRTRTILSARWSSRCLRT